MLAAAFGAGSAILPFLALFGATQVVWPLLSVASNTLAVTLSPAHRAESVGLLNAATSLGATVGGALGGTLLPYGFAWLCAGVLGALLVAFGLAWHPKMRIDLAEA
jgi:MFS family permease